MPSVHLFPQYGVIVPKRRSSTVPLGCSVVKEVSRPKDIWKMEVGAFTWNYINIGIHPWKIESYSDSVGDAERIWCS